MTLPIIGTLGPCAVKTCWLICNVPMVGALPFPDLGNLTQIWKSDELWWKFVDDTQAQNVPVMDNLGGIDVNDGIGMPAIDNLGNWASVGDARAPMRNLKMVITLQTTSQMSTFDPVGDPLPWSDGLPDHGTTSPRTWEWTFLWSPLDSRLQSAQGKLTCDADGGWRSGLVFWNKQLSHDNVYVESGNTWGSGGVPDSKLAYPNYAVGAETARGTGGSATITALGNTYTYHGELPIRGVTFATTLTVVKSIPQSYTADPDDFDEATNLITFADHTLANYDLATLGRSYTFWSEDDGNGNSVQKTVTFQVHHCYYIWPFPQKVNGQRLTTIRWACEEPQWEQWWPGDPPSAPPWTAPSIQNPNGIYYTGLNRELWVESYNGVYIPPGAVYGVLNNRDLPRFGCVRRAPGAAISTGAGYSDSSPWPVTRNTDTLNFGMDRLFNADIMTLATFADYVEVSKCAVQVLAGDACIVQYSETSVGSPRLAWASDAGGQQPAIASSPGPCEGSQPPGNYFFDRKNITPTPTDPAWPTMALGFVLRTDQLCVDIDDGNVGTDDGGPIYFTPNYDPHANWPSCCEEGM